jgi:NAD(P) transhydrogenase
VDTFDLVVIGSGPAGEKGAAQAAYFGKRVALVERVARVGGAPVNSGGLPTKTLRETALYLTGYRRRELYGVGLDLGPALLLDRMRVRAAEVSEGAGAAVQDNLDRHHIEVVRGTAALGADRTVAVALPDGSTRVLGADVILVATGSRPFRPPDIPFDDPDVHDTDTLLRLDRLPGSLVVIGGGPVGCEYASIFGTLGVDVTLIDRAERVIPFLDAEISGELRDCLTSMGMRMLLGSSEASVRRADDGQLQVALPEETLTPDTVLFAAGRAGNTEELKLEQAGVALDPRGRIVVDGTYRTAAEGIYAAGDVIGPPALASVSAEQGRVAVCHAFGIPFKDTVDPLPPYGIYTIPEVGMVGMTEEAAAGAGIDYETGRCRFAQNPRSQIAGTTYGLVKLVFRREDRRLLGAHIVGEEAAELIHVAQSVLHAEETIDRFIHSTFNIPTRAEVYKYAAYDGLQRLAGRPIGAGVEAPAG